MDVIASNTFMHLLSPDSTVAGWHFLRLWPGRCLPRAANRANGEHACAEKNEVEEFLIGGESAPQVQQAIQYAQDYDDKSK